MDRPYQDKFRELGLKIAYYRKLRGMTQEQLAEAIGMSTVFISHVEAPNIDRTVSLGTLFAIAEVLDVPIYKFFLFDEVFSIAMQMDNSCPSVFFYRKSNFFSR